MVVRVRAWRAWRCERDSLASSTHSSSSRGEREREAAAMASQKHLYVVVAKDDQSCGPADPPIEPRNGSKKRVGVYPQHKEYQALTGDPANPNYIHKVTAGPMVDDTGKYMVGSAFIVEAASKEEVWTFLKGDPFWAANVWADVTVERYFSVHGITAMPPSSL